MDPYFSTGTLSVQAILETSNDEMLAFLKAYVHLKTHRLRPTLRTIVEIQQVHDTSIKEIAEIAGISVAATKSRLLRAGTVLRRSLG